MMNESITAAAVLHLIGYEHNVVTNGVFPLVCFIIYVNCYLIAVAVAVCYCAMMVMW